MVRSSATTRWPAPAGSASDGSLSRSTARGAITVSCNHDWIPAWHIRSFPESREPACGRWRFVVLAVAPTSAVPRPCGAGRSSTHVRAGKRCAGGEVSDPADLEFVPLDGSTGVPSDDPVICVCTHARHDQCCAVKGRPAVTALAREYPEWTWECSHLGGDRFAATMILFPHGLHYGRVPAADAERIVEAYRRGEVVPRYFRGRSSDRNVVQAAEAFARAELGDLRIDAFSVREVSASTGEHQVVFDSAEGVVRVSLSDALSEPLLSTCESTVPVRVRQFELESVTVDPAPRVRTV